MAQNYEGHLVAEGLKIGAVVGRFNEFITSKLLSGAQDCFVRHGGMENDFETSWVPGAFEIPLAAKLMAKAGKYDAIICLGTVIRGSTPHFDYVASEVSKGISKLTQELELPIIFGVLTTDTIEQAVERAGTKAGNKGWEAALSGIEMANLVRKFR